MLKSGGGGFLEEGHVSGLAGEGNCRSMVCQLEQCPPNIRVYQEPKNVNFLEIGSLQK